MREKKTRVMVFGTFDGVHNGHLHFLSQARHLVRDPYLIVSVARDANVAAIKKDTPDFSERKRMSFIRKTGLADRVILGGAGDHIPHIVRERPDVIALGYDQRAYVENLAKDLKNKGITVTIFRLKPYKKDIYKNHLLKKGRLL